MLGGPVLKYEACFGEDDLVKAKADWKLRGNEARLELQPKISPQCVFDNVNSDCNRVSTSFYVVHTQ